MSASVDITTATAAEALLIPYASVVTRKFAPDSIAAESNDDTGGVFAATNDSDAAGQNDAGLADDNSESPKRRKSEKVKKSGVFVVNNGIVSFVEVETGIADELNIVALSGVQPGDTVVSGSFQTLRKLSDSDRVRISEQSLEKMREESR